MGSSMDGSNGSPPSDQTSALGWTQQTNTTSWPTPELTQLWSPTAPTNPYDPAQEPKQTTHNASSQNIQLHFITASNPKGFKQQKVMKKIRGAAMNQYLRNYEKPPASAGNELHVSRQRSRDLSIPRVPASDDKITDVMQSGHGLKLLQGMSTREKRRVISDPSYEEEMTALSIPNPTSAQLDTQVQISIPGSMASWQPLKDIVTPSQTNIPLPHDSLTAVVKPSKEINNYTTTVNQGTPRFPTSEANNDVFLSPYRRLQDSSSERQPFKSSSPDILTWIDTDSHGEDEVVKDTDYKPMLDRPVSPSLHLATSALYIRNLMRPLHPRIFRTHLVFLASPPYSDPDPSILKKVFLNSSRTHAFAIFDSISAAGRVRSTLHGTVWPAERGRKELWVDFVLEERVQAWIDSEEEVAGDSRGWAGGSKNWTVDFSARMGSTGNGVGFAPPSTDANLIPLAAGRAQDKVEVVEDVPVPFSRKDSCDTEEFDEQSLVGKSVPPQTPSTTRRSGEALNTLIRSLEDQWSLGLRGRGPDWSQSASAGGQADEVFDQIGRLYWSAEPVLQGILEKFSFQAAQKRFQAERLSYLEALLGEAIESMEQPSTDQEDSRDVPVGILHPPTGCSEKARYANDPPKQRLDLELHPQSVTLLYGEVKPYLTKEQHDTLEAHFQQRQKPSTSTKKGFSEALGVPMDKISDWFQNRRTKAFLHRFSLATQKPSTQTTPATVSIAKTFQLEWSITGDSFLNWTNDNKLDSKIPLSFAGPPSTAGSSNALSHFKDECSPLSSASRCSSLLSDNALYTEVTSRRVELLERLMVHFYSLFDEHDMIKYCAGSSSSSSPSSTGFRQSSSEQTDTNGAGRKGGEKHSPPKNGNSDDGLNNRLPETNIMAADDAEYGRRFACPYFKRNPRRYQRMRSCPGPGWDSVHRVKEHLYRRHELPIQCPRCYKQFKIALDLTKHQRALEGCEIRDEMPAEGFDKEQEKKLKSRKRSAPDLSDEDRWREIYMILFPDDDPSRIPTAYYDYELGHERPISPDAAGFAKYEEYLGRELPRYVRKRLERALDEELEPVEERLKAQIVDIVKTCQEELFRNYQSSFLPALSKNPTTAATEAAEPSSTVLEQPHQHLGTSLANQDISNHIPTVFAPAYSDNHLRLSLHHHALIEPDTLTQADSSYYPLSSETQGLQGHYDFNFQNDRNWINSQFLLGDRSTNMPDDWTFATQESGLAYLHEDTTNTDTLSCDWVKLANDFSFPNTLTCDCKGKGKGKADEHKCGALSNLEEV